MTDPTRYCRCCERHLPTAEFWSETARCRSCRRRIRGERLRGGVKTCRSCLAVKPDAEFITQHRCREWANSKVWRHCGQRKAIAEFHSLGRVCSPCYPVYKRANHQARYSDAETRARILAQNKAWKRAAAPRYRSQQLAYRSRQRVEMKTAVLRAYGGCCSCCGEREVLFLTLDHARDDGASFRKALGMYDTWKHAYRLGFPDTYRLRCFNCNAGRYRNGGQCPHVSNRLRATSNA